MSSVGLYDWMVRGDDLETTDERIREYLRSFDACFMS